MSTHLVFPEANPVRIIRTNFTGLNYSDPDNLLFHQFSFPNTRSFTQPFEQKDPLFFQFESSFDINIIRLHKWGGLQIQIDDAQEDSVLYEDSVAVESEDSGSFEFEGSTGSSTEIIKIESGFNVYQAFYDLLNVPPGIYVLLGEGSMDSGSATYRVESELIEVRQTWKNSTLFKYFSNEPNFGIDWRSGVTMQFRILADFVKPANETEFDNIIAASSLVTKLTDVTAKRRMFELWEKTPSWMIDKVNHILGQDFISIDDAEVTGADRLVPEYEGFGTLVAQPSTVINLKRSDLSNRHDSGTRTLF